MKEFTLVSGAERASEMRMNGVSTGLLDSPPSQSEQWL